MKTDRLRSVSYLFNGETKSNSIDIPFGDTVQSIPSFQNTCIAIHTVIKINSTVFVLTNGSNAWDFINFTDKLNEPIVANCDLQSTGCTW